MTISKSFSLLVIMMGLSQLTACDNKQNNSTAQKDNTPMQTRPTEPLLWQPVNSEVKTDENIEAKIAKLLSTMTLEQKVAQMIQPEIRDITVEDMRQYGFGSYLNGGGAFPNNNKHATPQDWIALAEAMYQASIDDSLDGSTIPTMWGTDAVHGHNNVIGATLFPHNIGLGAANNPELIEKIAQITATEVMVTGIDWVFAPTVATVRDDRWGRTYEGYSEDPEIVKAYARAIVYGLQGRPGQDFLADNRVISTVKHFLGDGGTVGGDDQGNNIDSEQTLYDIHAQGYVSGLGAGSQSVMASFNSWHGKKNHGNRYLLTEALKEKMGFDGFVVGDWNGHGQIKGCTNDNCPQAINAGLDIFMVPTDAWKPLYENTIKQVKDGIIEQSRIDDAVSRILRVKFRAGLFEKPSPAKRQFSGKTELIGAPEHRTVARQAVRQSLVLLKNKQQLLPLSPKLNILVAGDGADNIGKQSGGWTITWQGTNNENADFPGATSIYAGLAKQVQAAGGNIELNEQGNFTTKPDVAIVVFGEEPYAEGQGDREHLAYQSEDKKDLALLKKLQAQGIKTIAVFITGRPMWVNAELNASDAFVVAWLPGTEGEGIADVLLKDNQGKMQYDFNGKLTFSWPAEPTQIVNRFDENYQPLFAYGFGLKYGDNNVVADNLPEVFEINSAADESVAIFQAGLQAPWQMTLFSSGQASSEGVRQAINANTHQLNGVNYRTVDKVVQEDAFRLTFTGEEMAGIEFTAELTSEEKQAIADKSYLSLTVNVSAQVNAENSAFYLAFDCQKGNTSCDKQVNIAGLLAQIPNNQWHDIQIAASCFNQPLVNQLSLFTEQAFVVDIASLTFTDQAAENYLLTCD